MRSLYPDRRLELSDAELVDLYAFPGDGDCSGDQAWVRANFVSTLDGAAQGSDHKSGTISDKSDKRIFALLRSLCDVILIGASTTRVEGYRPVKRTEARESIRRDQGLTPLPAIAVVSRSLDLHPDLVAGGGAPTILITVQTAPVDALTAIRRVAPVIIAGEFHVDFSHALAQLVAMGYRRILCEGGPTLLHDLAACGCLDELCLTFSPLLAAGERLRITHGPAFVPPHRLYLRHLLEHDGELFARYAVTAYGG
ncbi:MAG: pyrimidine reductase family protein [Nocardioidaceae bacterium]